MSRSRRLGFPQRQSAFCSDRTGQNGLLKRRANECTYICKRTMQAGIRRFRVRICESHGAGKKIRVPLSNYSSSRPRRKKTKIGESARFLSRLILSSKEDSGGTRFGLTRTPCALLYFLSAKNMFFRVGGKACGERATI